MSRNNSIKSRIGIALASLLVTSQSSAQLTFPTVPLFTSGSAEPNVMLVIDSSGSMRNIVADRPYIASTSNFYQTTGTNTTVNAETACPSARRAPTNKIISVALPTASGAPRFYYDGSGGAEEDTLLTFGTASGNVCFDPTQSYGAKLNPLTQRGAGTQNFTGTTASFYVPEGRGGLTYFESGYPGNYLNWYFNAGSVPGVTWNSGAQLFKPISATDSVKTRITVAQKAASDLVDTVDSRVRMGLAIYDGNDGGKLPVNSDTDGTTTNTVIGPLSATGKRAGLKTAIDNIEAGGNTPLAETLSDIGRYFTSGNTAGTLLKLHPERTGAARNSCADVSASGVSSGTSTCDLSVDSVFSRRLGGAASDPTAPVTLSCQKNFITFLTDGRNTQDLTIANNLRDYDGDCSPTNALCSGINANNYERKTNRNYDEPISSNARATSDYMDDVAKALYEIDLRPTGTFSGQTGTPSADELGFLNNVRTDIIGFADPTVQNDALLQNTASQGGGTFRPAADAAALATAFKNILDDVLATSGSASNASTSAGRLGDGSRLYQAGFNSGDWSGYLKSFQISTGTGGPCASIATGNICTTPEWDAADRLNSTADTARRIYTMKSVERTGTPFLWANLSPTQKSLLQLNPATLVADVNPATGPTVGEQRLLYIRGDRTNEGSLAGDFRVRSGKLGDVVNSDPALVAAPRFNYNFAGYAAFRNTYKDRTPVIYIGGNDGMLHGFRTTGTGLLAGSEVLGYVPTTAYGTTTAPTLSKLTQTPFTHQFVVDGSPAVGDVQIGAANDAWATVLVAGMRSGGRGMFALNVTDPANFTDSNAAYSAGTPNGVVMWEFTSADDAALGFTYSQPSIVKMRNGKWAAIFGNGYNSTMAGADANKAALFIVFLTGPTGGTSPKTWTLGTDYIKLTVNSAATAAVANVIDANTPNGLASPTPVDIDGDRVIDFIYAGDLNGNLWRFDVDDASTANWKVAYAPNTTSPGLPVYTARDVDTTGNKQPITGRPEVGFNLLTDDDKDLVVYFGTGKYLENRDNTQTGQPNQSFYGIFDDPYADNGTKNTTPQASNRASLLKQTVVSEATSGTRTFRTTSDNALTVGTHKGWFIDLFNTSNGTETTGGVNKNRGERSVSSPVLNNGTILFSTQIPAASACSGGGSGFLMALDAKNGRRLTSPQFDSNSNGSLDSGDIASGVQSQVGIIDRPVVFNISAGEDKIFLTGTGKPGETPPPGCGSSLECVSLPSNDRRGRVTWREIIK